MGRSLVGLVNSCRERMVVVLEMGISLGIGIMMSRRKHLFRGVGLLNICIRWTKISNNNKYKEKIRSKVIQD